MQLIDTREKWVYPYIDAYRLVSNGGNDMPVTGKTGADAIFIAMKHICRLIVKYNLKIASVIAAAYAAGAITAQQQTDLNLFLANATAFCIAWEALAAYSGF